MSDEKQENPKPVSKGNIIAPGDSGLIVGSVGHSAMVISNADRHSVREWWHEILRNHGHYSCYAIFLTLPSDTEALRYQQQNIEFLHKTGQSVASKVGGIAEKTFEKAMEAWISATIK